MRHTLGLLILLCAAASPLTALAQNVPAPMPRLLGVIPQGTEQMVQVTGMLDLSRQPSQDEVNAALTPITFSLPASSGFCVSAMTLGEPTIVLVNGANRDTGRGLFNADSGNDGLSKAEGRRTLVRTVGMVPDANFLLSTIVAQNGRAPGNAVTIFVRVYPDTTPETQLDALCGPFREGSMQAPMP